MARKSRKNNPFHEQPPKQEKQYNVAVYVRLSIEDRRDKKDSDSLEHQKNLIYDYIKGHSDMKIHTVYSDNGETGTNFERPEFQRMMYDIYNGTVNCIIVKDLSRFGREYIEAGDYLERIFPLIGVRFIAINDNYDNLSQATDIIIPIKNIINTLYAKDMSKKSSAALRIKQAKGEFIGTYASYGYLKSPDNHHKLIIDEETAPVVKQIFEWKSEGLSMVSICRRLADLNIMPPSKYRYDKGMVKDKRYADLSFWCSETLKAMLSNPVYLGHMTQGRSKSHFYEGKKTETLPKEKWIVVENTHEAIISQELFDKVQYIMQERNTQYHKNLGKYDNISKPENIFKGKIVCGDCGTNLTRYKSVNKHNNVYYSYICSTHSKFPDKCDFLSIGETLLADIVMKSIKMQISNLTQLETLLETAKKRPEIRKKQYEINKKMRDVYANISYLKDSRRQLLLNFAKNILSEEEYEYARKQFDFDLEQENEKLSFVKKEQEGFDKIFIKNTWIAELKRHKNLKLLTKDIINTFIRQIKIYTDKTINIEWTFKDEYQALLSVIQGGPSNER